MDYVTEARELVQQLDQRVNPSAYDIGWLARLSADSNGSVRWPDLSEWLLAHQHADGSWGGKVTYYHDRVICTLAAAIALKKANHSEAARQALRRAERYLWTRLHLLRNDPFELVGFELIFPTLLATTQAMGLDVPVHTYGYGEIQTAKIRLIPPDMLYSPRISTVHSLEFMGNQADRDKLQAALADNGSLGNSPAATAYYLSLHPREDRAWAYLEEVRRKTGVVYLYPFRTFEQLWVLNSLAYSGHGVTEFAGPAVWEELRSQLGPAGIGLDPTFGIPDGDCTSACCRLLIEAGYEVNAQSLAYYEDPQRHIIRTYLYERNASVSTNVHALAALSVMPDYPNRRAVQEQIILMLLDKRVYGIYWVDKWHASPYYATSHALVGLMSGDYYLAYFCQPTIDWFLHTQRDDGSWGFFTSGTAEETAYVLMALLHYSRSKAVDPDVLHRAAAYLAGAYDRAGSAYPEFWIGKSLFAPYDVIRSVILAALILYQDTFGRVAG